MSDQLGTKRANVIEGRRRVFKPGPLVNIAPSQLAGGPQISESQLLFLHLSRAAHDNSPYIVITADRLREHNAERRMSLSCGAIILIRKMRVMLSSHRNSWVYPCGPNPGMFGAP